MKTLIVYYSHSGNTKNVALQIGKILKADLLEIKPSKPYPSDYAGLSKAAKKERDAGVLPDLQAFDCHIEAYDTIVVGTPNWWNTMALPLRTFLTTKDLKDKKVVAFCTHGGGGEGHIFKDIAQACNGEVDVSGFSVYGQGNGQLKENIVAWLDRINCAF